MDRREFVQLSTGIIGGLGIPAVFGDVASAAGTAEGNGTALDSSYLVKGLTGMARAEGWFDAHWGAGVLAGYYLCRENRLDEQTATGVKKQLDAVIRLRAAQFAPLPEEPADETIIAKVPAALRPAIQGGLRAHGHAVIFASHSLNRSCGDATRAPTVVVAGRCGAIGLLPRLKLNRTNQQAVCLAELHARLGFPMSLWRESGASKTHSVSGKSDVTA